MNELCYNFLGSKWRMAHLRNNIHIGKIYSLQNFFSIIQHCSSQISLSFVFFTQRGVHLMQFSQCGYFVRGFDNFTLSCVSRVVLGQDSHDGPGLLPPNMFPSPELENKNNRLSIACRQFAGSDAECTLSIRDTHNKISVFFFLTWKSVSDFRSAMGWYWQALARSPSKQHDVLDFVKAVPFSASYTPENNIFKYSK